MSDVFSLPGSQMARNMPYFFWLMERRAWMTGRIVYVIQNGFQ
ncbi:hypothetical protein [Komagataeibacter xylinus]|nr:hypothetical protein [Komagataeibacter xylinus]